MYAWLEKRTEKNIKSTFFITTVDILHSKPHILSVVAGGPAGEFADGARFSRRILGDKTLEQWLFGEEADKKTKGE